MKKDYSLLLLVLVYLLWGWLGFVAVGGYLDGIFR